MMLPLLRQQLTISFNRHAWHAAAASVAPQPSPLTTAKPGATMPLLCGLMSKTTSPDDDSYAVCRLPGLQAPAQGAEHAVAHAKAVLRGEEPGPELRVDFDHVPAIRRELVST